MALSRFVQRPSLLKLRNDQLLDVAENGKNQEYGKYLILQALNAVGRVPEGKANEESLPAASATSIAKTTDMEQRYRSETQKTHGPEIRRGAPELLEAPLTDGIQLRDEARSVLAGWHLHLGRGRFAETLLHFGQLLLHRRLLGRTVPHVSPVDRLLRFFGSRRNAQDPIGRVLAARARPRSVLLEILDHGAAILSQRAEVDGLPGAFEQEQLIEHLKENGRGLVYGAHYRLPARCQLPEQGANRPRRLAVKTRGRFVHAEVSTREEDSDVDPGRLT